MKADWTFETDSRVDMRVKILSTTPSVADSAGTKHPIWQVSEQ